ncbi:hypothetical protein [Gracilibacillus sp. YIM 98692]|uniref:hypothetical protein n=1 Tax=Gracilibacillus sp. YIM 98692 TaxID=2663532 RepID=UPI0013D82121|nr:hypothetical protein [Gracilibacillus sp. YIM 98692]
MKNLWATLKTMSFKEAVDYIWEYYKLHIFGIAFGLFFIISITSNILKEEKETLNFMVVGAVNYNMTEAISTEINEQYFDDFRVAVDLVQHGGGSAGSQSYAQMQKLVAKISVGEVDIMLANQDFSGDLIDQEGLTPLGQVVDEELLEQSNVEIHRLDSGEIYGIGIEQFDVLKDVENIQESILVIPATSENDERVAEFLTTLLEG